MYTLRDIDGVLVQLHSRRSHSGSVIGSLYWARGEAGLGPPAANSHRPEFKRLGVSDWPDARPLCRVHRNSFRDYMAEQPMLV